MDEDTKKANDLITDRTLNETYSFWNTLFTFHRIMISAIAIVTAVNGRIPRFNIIAVIDNRINWYGSINLLSFSWSEESAMRLVSGNIAHELIETLNMGIG